MYKIFVFSPDKEDILYSIMNAAANAGAGIIGNYTHCGFFTKGVGNWKAGLGSNPTLGNVGEYSH